MDFIKEMLYFAVAGEHFMLHTIFCLCAQLLLTLLWHKKALLQGGAVRVLSSP